MPPARRPLARLARLALEALETREVPVLQVAPTQDAAALLSSLLGSGITASNVVLVSNQNGGATRTSTGTFTDSSTGAAGIGLASGVVFSTGAVEQAPSPRATSASTSFSAPTDADLAAAIPGTYFDATSLRFDFTATGDRLSVNYVLASEESFGGSFADAFAFLVRDLTAGETTFRNIALIPGTTTPVSVGNIGPSTNSAFFRDNSGSINTVYNGLSTVLTAETDLVVGHTYQFKLVLADLGDRIVDTAVFLGAGSFAVAPSAPSAPSAPEAEVSFDTSSGNGTVRVLNADGTTRFLFNPYAGFTGPVSSALGDVTGDGVSDVFTAARGTVTAFDGATGARFEAQPFVGYTGAISLAAGDLTGDGVVDVAITAMLNGNTMVFSGATGALIVQFNAFSGHNGPVELAIGDLNGDGANELVAVARRPAGLQVNVYDIANLRVIDALTLAAPGGDRFSVAVTDPATGPGNLVISSGGTVAVIDTQARAVRALFDLNATVPDVELDIMGGNILVSAPLGGRTGVLRVSGDTFDVLGVYFADEPPLVG
jgi:hypothetical protein